MSDQVTPLARYFAYGMVVASELPMPEFEIYTGENSADLTISVLEGFASLDAEAGTQFTFGEDVQHLAWPTVGAFTIYGVNRIDVMREAGVEDSLLRLPLIGPVLALLLHLRGLVVLHASAVGFGDQAVVFMGDKGAGKSTTAAALVAMGHRLIADDIVAIDVSHPQSPVVVPGFPQMKVDRALPASFRVQNSVALEDPVPDFPKQLRRLTAGFSNETAHPGRFFVLDRGGEPAVAPMAPADALKSLMRFSYMSRFPTRPRGPAEATRQLKAFAGLSSSGSVRRLRLADDLERIREASAIIRSDLLL
ncbi:serine kinase [Caulobacter sp. S45]|uniref:serine kinase n=1 Tax=Caulobacter sp. S45 TaxID=1641861 RepID=UPI00131C8A4B|nr:serine kinase [Caulobacter sp. S45]